ncbi:MAG: hypothetical protein DMG75_04440 [Acidobacteria bacterium]|nr:MAG: hypothetical protein DMG75_04440 [Acidobacteriota bacterium]
MARGGKLNMNIDSVRSPGYSVREEGVRGRKRPTNPMQSEEFVRNSGKSQMEQQCSTGSKQLTHETGFRFPLFLWWKWILDFPLH